MMSIETRARLAAMPAEDKAALEAWLRNKLQGLIGADHVGMPLLTHRIAQKAIRELRLIFAEKE